MDVTLVRKLLIRYDGTDTSVPVPWSDSEAAIREEYERVYQQTFGFIMQERGLVIETVTVEAISKSFRDRPAEKRENSKPGINATATASEKVQAFFSGKWMDTYVYVASELPSGVRILGPAILNEGVATTVVEPGWQVDVGDAGMVLSRHIPLERTVAIGTTCDPIYLEIFNNLFMNIAEQIIKDIDFLIEELGFWKINDIDDVMNSCQELGGISTEYFAEEFIFLIDEDSRVHDDDYLQINWGLS